ncbi:MAG: zinc ribbon domain-containing protein [Oscillospiraceae bacterium]|nr:zinc ribbon domain-containing protein [Oscillospiraceae bacterium]
MMPFYDLYCPGCDSEHNIMATMADKTNRNIPCPNCGTTNLETLYRSAPAYIKGGGDMPFCANAHSCGAVCPHR